MPAEAEARVSKVCCRCRADKPLTLFWRDRYETLGRKQYCIECDTGRLKANRDQQLLKSRERYAGTRERDLLRWRRYKQRADVRSAQYERLRGSPKTIARQLLQRAVIAGTVKRPDRCQGCGLDCKPDGHHHDYSRPLDVVWLCRTCHGLEHRRAV